MTRLAIIFSLLFVTPAWAEEQKLTDNICPDLGRLAETFMSFRQKGVPLSRVMEVEVPEVIEGVRELALAAYEETQWSTEERRADAIRRFRNSVELDCYKTLLKK